MAHMTQKKAKRVILIGLDGLIPEMVKKFVKEGNLPVMAKLLKEGAFAESLSSPPVDTPTNWTSLATGAWTGSHGVNTFGVHKKGEPFEVVHNVNSNIFPRMANIAEETVNELCKAEYIWQAAERQGKKCILVNYPGGWPPNIKNGIIIDGSGPHSSPLCKLSVGGYFVNTEESSNESGIGKMKLASAKGWKNLPLSYSPLLEAAVPILGETSKEMGIMSSPIYNLLVIDSQGRGYDKVIIARNKDALDPIASLMKDQFSSWINEDIKIDLNRKVWGFINKKVRLKGKFKLKLSQLSKDGRRIKIYRTSIYNSVGWAYPQRIADELIECFGKEDMRKLNQVKDEDLRISPFAQVYERISDQAEGIAKTCKYLSNHYDWDLLFTQIHAPDGLNHAILSGICPESSLYDPSKKDLYYEEFRSEYKILDKAVGDIIEGCADENTLVVVLSDHGGIAIWRVVKLIDFLVKKGLVAYKVNDEKKEVSMDWKRSKVVLGSHPLAQNIWVNLRGRESEGIVEAKEYEKIRDEVINTLYEVRDPENGRCPVVLALKKEDAQFLGQWGERVGDIIYYLEPGYIDDALALVATKPVKLEAIQRDSFRPVQSLLAEGGFDPKMLPGAHHAYLPTAKLSGCSVKGVFIISGPGIKKNYERKVPIWTVDVTPTISYLLGIASPAQSEGKIIADILKV